MPNPTAFQLRALTVLATDDFTPRTFAMALWPDSPAWQRRTRGRDNRSGAIGGTMPMKGAKELWRLRDLGFARERPDGRWTITSVGRAHLDGSA